ncbi:cupin fold metalloprotein, WbuC family [Candidatus Parcubacteria bacterium]|nr:MAG: cupin fold metalloprotein, WbuC family [Candidatus Parcubacteria bacterium]
MFIKANRLDDLTKEARESIRKRAHLLLHRHIDPVLRLVMAMEPDSYVQPHRHLGDNRQESYIALRGKFIIILFDNLGYIKEYGLIGPKEENLMFEVPSSAWHVIWSLEKGSLVAEIIKGPYVEKTFKEFAVWAPSEEDPSKIEYKKRILNLLKLSK